MTIIIKQGKRKRPYKFICNFCECEFVTDEYNKYFADEKNAGYGCRLETSCPNCENYATILVRKGE